MKEKLSLTLCSHYMMQISNAEDLRGYRPPSENEIQGVARVFRKHYSSGIRICKTAVYILCALGLILFSSYDQLGWSAIVFGLIAYSAAVIAITSKNRFRAYQTVFEEGAFQVIDGYVSDISSNDGRPGFLNVRFSSLQGQTLLTWCAVRQEDIFLSAPLLLVHVEKGRIRNGITWAFTPFMLSQEADKLHW